VVNGAEYGKGKDATSHAGKINVIAIKAIVVVGMPTIWGVAFFLSSKKLNVKKKTVTQDSRVVS